MKRIVKRIYTSPAVVGEYFCNVQSVMADSPSGGDSGEYGEGEEF